MDAAKDFCTMFCFNRENHSSKNYIQYLKSNFLEDNDEEDHPGRDILLNKIKDPDYLSDKIIIEGSLYKQEKMSEIILDFAKPLLDAAEDTAAIHGAIAVAVIAWNISLLPLKEQNEMMERMAANSLPYGFKKFDPVLRKCLELLLKRKQESFSNYKRMIGDFHCEPSEDGIDLNVVSLPTKEEMENIDLEKISSKSLARSIKKMLGQERET